MKKDRHQQSIFSDIKFDHTLKGLFQKTGNMLWLFLIGIKKWLNINIVQILSTRFLYKLKSDFAKYPKKSICKVICLMSDFQIMISSLCVKAIYEQIFV